MSLLESALSIALLVATTGQATAAIQSPPLDVVIGERSDLLWARPAVADPAAWAQLVSTAEARKQAQTTALARQVASLVGHPVRLQDECGRDIGCFAILEIEALRPTLDALAFEQDRTEAARVVAAALSAAHGLDKEAQDAALLEPARLIAFARRDQALRGFFNALYDDDALATMPPRVQSLAVVMIRMELRRRDLEAADYLASLVARTGWPLRETHGEQAVEAAWLIAQHADRDPAFQVKALMLLQSNLAKSHERARDYAFLYDRVAIAIGNPQRYATQIVCENHKYRIAATEDVKGLDDRRHTIGLGPVASRVFERGEPC